MRDIQSFAARWNENAWRIAVCLHAAKYSVDAASRELDAETTQRAIGVMEWFIAQQIEILAASRTKAKRDVQDMVLSLLADNRGEITARDVLNKRIRPDAQSCKSLLDELELSGLLVDEDKKPQPSKGGHSVRVYRLAKS